MLKAILIFIFIINFSSFTQSNTFYLDNINPDISYFDVKAKGSPEDSEFSATRKHSAYLQAKQIALINSIYFIQDIRTKDNQSLKELSETDDYILMIFEDVIEEAKNIETTWDNDDNVFITLRINLLDLKNKLKKIGVE